MRRVLVGWILSVCCLLTPLSIAYGVCYPSGKVDWPVGVDGMWQTLPHPNCSQTIGTSSPVAFQAQPFWVEVTGTYNFEWGDASEGDFFVLYADGFDSTAPLNQCLEGAFVIKEIGGQFAQFDRGLQAHRQYYLVSTSPLGQAFFRSPFVFGPGKVHLGMFPGLGGDLAVSMSVDAEMPKFIGQTLVFSLEAENLGPADQNGVRLVSRLHPALSYVTDTCGGSVEDGLWSSDLGDLAAGATASCEVTATYLECRSIAVAAAVEGQLGEDDVANNRASTSVSAPAAMPLQDGGFELGDPNPHWSPFSPIFDFSPHTGDWHLSFVGDDNSASQTLVIPQSADAWLTFYLENVPDFEPGLFEVWVDNSRLWSQSGISIYGTSFLPHCYQKQGLDISSFADGGLHTVEFRFSGSTQFGGFFRVDDVAVEACPSLGGDLALTLEADTTSPGLRQTFGITATAEHLGGDLQTGVTVTSALPEHLAYVDDTCGGSFSAGMWSWNVGTLNSGEQQACQIQVTQTVCQPSEMQATINGSTFDLPSNNSPSLMLSAEAERVADGGFELGNPHPSWVSIHSSDFFGLLCGDGTTPCSPVDGFWYPYQGDVWAWLNATTSVPSSRLEQALTIPATGDGFLELWLRIREADDSGDYLRIDMDGTDLALIDEDTAAYGGDYNRLLLDVSPWADDQSHTLGFTVPTDGTAQFHFDDVSLAVCARGPVTCPGSTDPTDGDSDGVPDACDLCDPGDDFFDTDLDGVPDDCDACAGFNDAEDIDNDGIPDGCDTCTDLDGDGVCQPFDCNDDDPSNACNLFRNGFESGDLSGWSAST